MFKNCIIKAVLFILIGLMGLEIVSTVFVPEWNYPVFTENVGLSMNGLKQLPEETEVVFLGASHIEYAVMPMQLYQKYGIVSYNAATSGQYIEISYFIINSFLDMGIRPKVIMLDAGCLYNEGVYEAPYCYVLDNMKLDLNKLELIKGYYNHRYNVSSFEKNEKVEICKDLLGKLFPLYKYHYRWDEINKDDMLFHYNNNYFSQGASVTSTVNKSWTNQKTVDFMAELTVKNQGKSYYKNIGEVLEGDTIKIKDDIYYRDTVGTINQNYLKMIVDICDDYGCQLVLTKVPVMKQTGDYTSSWTLLRHNNTAELAHDLCVPFIDLQYDCPIDVDWIHDTCDGGGHLNYSGAKKVTDYVGEWLSSNYDIGGQTVEGYDHKLEKYEKYCDIADIESSYEFESYCSSIMNSKNKLITVISVGTDMRTGLTERDIKALQLLGLNTDFTNMELYDSYIAVIDGEKVRYEGLSNRQLKYQTTIDGVNINVISTGFLDGTESSIIIDNKEYSINSRGINIVVYDRDSGIVIDRATCDTWSQEHEVLHEVQNLLFKYQEYLINRS